MFRRFVKLQGKDGTDVKTSNGATFVLNVTIALLYLYCIFLYIESNKGLDCNFDFKITDD